MYSRYAVLFVSMLVADMGFAQPEINDRFAWEEFHVLGQAGVETITKTEVDDSVPSLWKFSFNETTADDKKDRVMSQAIITCNKDDKSCGLYISLMAYRDLDKVPNQLEGKGHRIQMHRRYYAGFDAIVESKWITIEAANGRPKTVEFKPEGDKKSPFTIKCTLPENTPHECYVRFYNTEPKPVNANK